MSFEELQQPMEYTDPRGFNFYVVHAEHHTINRLHDDGKVYPMVLRTNGAFIESSAIWYNELDAYVATSNYYAAHSIPYPHEAVVQSFLPIPPRETAAAMVQTTIQSEVMEF